MFLCFSFLHIPFSFAFFSFLSPLNFFILLFFIIVYNDSLRAEEEMQCNKYVRTATASVCCVRLLSNGAAYGSLMFKM